MGSFLKEKTHGNAGTSPTVCLNFAWQVPCWSCSDSLAQGPHSMKVPCSTLLPLGSKSSQVPRLTRLTTPQSCW